MGLLFNIETKRQVDGFTKNPPHAIGIFGPHGSGKFAVAEYIASALLATNMLDNNPDLHIVRPEKKDSITIDQARDVISFLKLKGAYGSTSRRIVVVDRADTMTIEAQNALLKTLEEPPKGVAIIITALSTRSILPTITSRLKNISIQPVIKSQVDDFFKTTYSQGEIDKAWSISSGRVGLLVALLTNEQNDLLASIEQAKSFLGKSQYERLVQVDDIIKQDTIKFLEALQLVGDAAFKQASAKNSRTQAKKWHSVRKASSEAMATITVNAQAKLAMTNLALTL